MTCNVADKACVLGHNSRCESTQRMTCAFCFLTHKPHPHETLQRTAKPVVVCSFVKVNEDGSEAYIRKASSVLFTLSHSLTLSLSLSLSLCVLQAALFQCKNIRFPSQH